MTGLCHVDCLFGKYPSPLGPPWGGYLHAQQCVGGAGLNYAQRPSWIPPGHCCNKKGLLPAPSSLFTHSHTHPRPVLDHDTVGILYTVQCTLSQRGFNFPRNNTKCSEENVIQRGIFRVVCISFSPRYISCNISENRLFLDSALSRSKRRNIKNLIFLNTFLQAAN